MLSVRQVSLRFKGVRALAAIDVRLERGEMLGIIGPNGSGKSTLFNVITGIYRPDAGQVRFEGQEITGLPVAHIARLGIARTFQNKRLFGSLSALENVMVAALKGQPGSSLGDVLGLRTSRQGLAASRDHATRCLEAVGLASGPDLIAHDLPYGAQTRLEIARALALSPSLLLLDEPAAGLNPAERQEIREVIEALRTRGITLAIIEHDVRLVMGVCSRVIVLDHGEKIADGAPARVAADPRVLEAYFGTAEEAHAAGSPRSTN